MEGNPTTISNLKDFVNFYGDFKTDMELASMLDISVDEIRNVKITENSNRKVLTLV